jgi:hypothetical protein
MATGTRSLTLKLLADVDNFTKNLKGADNEVKTFGDKVDDFGKKAGMAFAAAGAAAVAYAGKLAIEGVKAAIEDEAAQLRLANALKNVTGATDEQVAATEKFITKTALAYGVTDDQMRPALERLTRSTKDVGEAQKLMALAIDISKAKNIDLTTVSNALAKANDGQVGALKKLGITLGDSAANAVDYNKEQEKLQKLYVELTATQNQYGISSKEYNKIQEKIAETQDTVNRLQVAGIDYVSELSEEFAGAGAQAANTYAGKMERLNIAFDEAKETVGSYILDGLTPLVDTLVNKIIPNIGAFAEKTQLFLTPAIEFISNFIQDTFSPVLDQFIKYFKSMYATVKDNQEIFIVLGTVLGGIAVVVSKTLGVAINTVLVPALKVVGGLATGLVTTFGLVSKAIVGIVEGIQKMVELLKNNPVTRGFGNLFSGASMSDVSMDSASPFMPSEPNFLDSVSRPRVQYVNQVTVNGAIDSESTARQIVSVLNDSQARGTLGSLALA